MSIWQKPISKELLEKSRENTLVSHLGITIEEIGDDYLKASMPVDSRTHQPMGILHGGASIALAETVGSMAGYYACDEWHYCVGMEVNGNHLRAVRSGTVFAIAKPIHLGRSTQVWDIQISNEEGKKVCASRLTMAVMAKPSKNAST